MKERKTRSKGVSAQQWTWLFPRIERFSTMPDQLERLRQLRRSVADTSEVPDLAKDYQPQAVESVAQTIEPNSLVSRDVVELVYNAMSDSILIGMTLFSVAFFSWFLGYLLFREIEQVWKNKGLLFPILRLLITGICCAFIWATMWVLVPTPVTSLRNALGIIGAILGLISSLAYAKEVLKI